MQVSAERRGTWLRRLLGLSWLVLSATSWPLWWGTAEFPRIPWLPVLVGVPGGVDQLLVGVLLAAAVVAVITPADERWTRWTSGLAWGSCSGLLLLDQHRLQPWAYQFWLLHAMLSLDRGMWALCGARVLTISVYFWSAVSKLDPGFAAGHGQMLLEGWARSLGGDVAHWGDTARNIAAWAMPAGELLTAGLLSFPGYRRWGTALSLAMHAQLLLAVGPWGLGHEPGVVIWNIYFMLQNLMLLGAKEGSSAAVAVGRGERGHLMLRIVLTAAVTAPALNPLGWWDHWPSWSVYSAHPAIVRVFIQERDVDRLPASLRGLVLAPEPLQSWRQVPFDQWSFAERRVPPYPQVRWKLALAAAVAERGGWGDRLRVEVLSRRGWWAVERDITRLEGVKEIRRRLSDTLINTNARRSP